MQVTVLGVGEAFDPTYPNTSVLVEAAGFALLVDCGHSVPPSLWRLAPEPDRVGDHSLVAHIDSRTLRILVVRTLHWREVHR